MFLRKSIFGTASMLGLAGILALGGCSADTNHDSDSDSVKGERELGSLGLGLQLPDGSNVANPTYTITRTATPGFVAITGSLTISGNVASGTINGLDAGTDYKVVLSATRSSPAGAPACTGTALFSVLAASTTTVNVTLQCDDTSADTGNVTINGTFNICPKIGTTTATPTTTTVGSPIAITATATDKDGDALTYAWTSTDGTFASASAANTTYTCTTAGTKTLNLSVSDGPSRGCVKALVTPITVTCTGSALDAGTPVVDSGTPVVDSGTPVVDSGTPVVDSGTPVVDSGTPVVDSGTPVVDSGVKVDSGTPVVDAGTPVVDSGTPVVDAGNGGPSAACVSCRQANCSNYLGALPLLDNCVDALCLSIVSCAEKSHTIKDPLTVTNPYCGNVTFDECNVSSYAPVGPCKALIEQGLTGPGEGTPSKDTVLERYIDPTYAGGNANYLLTCEADLCVASCL